MWRDDAYVLDMLIAARIARQFSEELTLQDFRIGMREPLVPPEEP
jgi:hypothetical protein